MKKRRRWHRIAIPFAIVAILICGSGASQFFAEPGHSKPHYLSPTVQGDTSANKLAELLKAKGITVRRETSTPEALTAVWSMGGKATLFVPAPEFVDSAYLWMLRQSPSGTRIVLVEPSDDALTRALPAVAAVSERWVTAVADPGANCELTSAKEAAVTRTRYSEWLSKEKTKAVGTYCYDQGLMSLSFNGIEFVVAGSPEPFRDDRLAEHDNKTLAVDLLGARQTVVWLDLHHSEPYPKTYSEQSPPPGGKPIPSLAPGKDVDRPDASPVPSKSYSPRPKPTVAQSQDADEPLAYDPPSPFPSWLMPLFLVLLVAAIALAFARGRRLGVPLTEPLPVEVRGAETAIGRSRLYRRAKARGPALDTLRLEARRRIAMALRLPVQVDPDLLVDTLAARLGEPRERLADILYGPSPQDDAELESRTTELLLLVEHVTRNGKERPS